MPLERPRPSTSPITEASRPITRPSSTTERMTCLREAPSVRSVANSRVRWATVIDRVLKITNAPTSSAMPREAEQELADHAHALVDLRGVRPSPAAALSLTSRFSGTSGCTASTSSVGRRAGRGRDRHAVEAALAAEQRLGGLDVPGRDAREAERVDVAERGDSRELVGASARPWRPSRCRRPGSAPWRRCPRR